MKTLTVIKSVKVSALKAKLIMPFRIATGQHDSVDNILLTIVLNNGVTGYGEAAVATHITGETIPQTIRSLKGFANTLEGKDIGDYFSLAQTANEYVGTNKSALAAIEVALFDALTKHLNMPLWKVWGQRPVSFNTDVTIVIADLEETVAKTKMFYRQGIRSFKIKVGRDMDLDFRRVCAVKNVVGKSTIILDANQGYSAKQTVTFLKMLAAVKVPIALIEQPVPKADWEGLKAVTRQTKVLVCADESVSSIPQAVRAIKEKAVGAINIKLMKTGLIHGAMIMQLAKANHIKLMIGGMMETSLAMTASAHLAAGVGGVDFIDLDTPFFIKDGLKNNPYLSKSGKWTLSMSQSGVGIKP